MSFSSIDVTESLPNDGVDEKHKRRRRSSSPFENLVRELAQMIKKFGEIYDWIESTKQQQIMELGKHLMAFTRDLEVQRMKLFMHTQIEVSKMEHAKHGGPYAVSSIILEMIRPHLQCKREYIDGSKILIKLGSIFDHNYGPNPSNYHIIVVIGIFDAGASPAKHEWRTIRHTSMHFEEF
jgi:hypothetical protein